MEYEHVCIDFNKYRDFENANVSIAEKEYEVFRKIQDQQYVSDFDREVKRLKGE